VVSLLATDPALSDDVGKDILAACQSRVEPNGDGAIAGGKGRPRGTLRCGGCLKVSQRMPADREPYIIAFWDRMKASIRSAKVPRGRPFPPAIAPSPFGFNP